MKIQVGIFSGSFNPIHVGHLILANYMSEFTYLDEVWMLVSPHNPLKKADDLLEDDVRLKMTELALENFDRLKVSDVEFHMPKPSYTINTLTKLSEENPDTEFSLIIGGDNWTKFSLWKEYEKILNNYKILIYPRLGEKVIIPDNLSKNVQVVSAPIIEVSSTFIRKSIREGKNMRAFVPEKVYDFIEENKLYK